MHRSEYFEQKTVASTRNVYWTKSWKKKEKKNDNDKSDLCLY